ncbi:MAG: hypothetical protein AAGL92_03960 [Pseudomonadota bacterium]
MAGAESKALSDFFKVARRMARAQGTALWPVGLIAISATLAFGGSAVSQSANLKGLGPSAADGGYRYFKIIVDEAALLHEPSSASAPKTVLSRDMLLSNLGCITDKNPVWCEVVSLKGKKKGFVHASDVQPASGADGAPPTGPNDSKARARKKDFDFDGEIKCAQVEGESLGKCRIQIARAGGGDATAVVTFSNSFNRKLYFRLGEFLRANTTMSGVGRDIDWALQGDMYTLRVDDQRFEIPAAFVLGD